VNFILDVAYLVLARMDRSEENAARKMPVTIQNVCGHFIFGSIRIDKEVLIFFVLGILGCILKLEVLPIQ